MKSQAYKKLVRSDLHRYAGNPRFRSFCYHFFWEPGFNYSFWMRTCLFLRSNPWLRLFFPFCWLVLHRQEYRFGISISYRTQIGSGFYIGHFGGIIVNDKAVIGRNCNISHQVTIGAANRGEHKGYPNIGDDVYIGPGAKIIGNVHIGDHAAVGANCVVTKDVPAYGVVGGVPGEILSMAGSEGYINQTDYL